MSPEFVGRQLQGLGAAAGLYTGNTVYDDSQEVLQPDALAIISEVAVQDRNLVLKVTHF